MSDDNSARFTANFHLTKRSIIVKNFIGGIAWGVGSVIGATLILALLIGFLRTINFVPIIGEFAAQVVNEVQMQRNLQ